MGRRLPQVFRLLYIPPCLRNRVAERIREDFPTHAQATVARLLDEYDEREVERVQLAILHLAAGDVEKLRHYVQQAKLDYRDVLYWAEYPND
jgi:hypothetical protein